MFGGRRLTRQGRPVTAQAVSAMKYRFDGTDNAVDVAFTSDPTQTWRTRERQQKRMR